MPRAKGKGRKDKYKREFGHCKKESTKLSWRVMIYLKKSQPKIFEWIMKKNEYNSKNNLPIDIWQSNKRVTAKMQKGFES
jgi:hypothetical protein